MERIKSPEDPFLKRIARNLPNKNQINNTPIRQRDLPNKENQAISQNRSNKDNKNGQTLIDNIVSAYPAETPVANSRTIPKKKISVIGKGCVNHLEAQAEFKISIDGESLNYCSKCAAHLASNGFKVERILSSRSPRRLKETSRPASQRRRQQLSAFIQNLKEVEEGYMQTGDKISKIQSSHEIQKQTITNFYSSLFQYLEYIKDEHMNFLDQEAKRNTQLCEIEGAEISQTLEELRAMREDIENNVDKIVDQVDQESYAECMTYYNQKKGVHEHRLEELGNDARPANCTTAECVEEKLNEFKYFIDQLTGILSSKAESVDY